MSKDDDNGCHNATKTTWVIFLDVAQTAICTAKQCNAIGHHRGAKATQTDKCQRQGYARSQTRGSRWRFREGLKTHGKTTNRAPDTPAQRQCFKATWNRGRLL